MLSSRVFTIRFTEDDRRVLARLRKLTGCNSSDIIRLALRDMLAAREAQAPLARTGT